MVAEQKRALAEQCLDFAMRGDYESAAKIRQQAYAMNPPASIGVNWSYWPEIWETDSRYIRYMNAEDFSDVDNSQEKIQAIKAGIFIDYLFTFRDCWGVRQQSIRMKEKFKSDAVEEFLLSKNWTFKSENRELIYTCTKKSNISAKIYLDSIAEKGINDTIHHYIFKKGEYYLGFPPDAPKRIIEGRRKWLEMFNQYLDMSNSNIYKFPKTFQTFEKHKKANSEKYRAWMDEYSRIVEKKGAV